MLGLTGLAQVCILWGAIYGLTCWLHRRSVLRRDHHRDVLAVGALVLATIAFFWPLFFTTTWIPKGGGDLSSFIYPIYAFAARWLKRGLIPLWNPHLYLGMPFAADNQSGLFYPLNWLFFFLTPTLTYQAVELMAVTHVFLAGLFTYLLLRDLPSASRAAPIGRIAAVAGAVAYMFSDLFIVHLGNLNIIATAAWLPLALLCFRRALRERAWGWAGWSGVVLGVAALAGHAQMFLYVGISLGLYTLFCVYVDRRAGWKTILTHLGKLAITGLIAFGLSALALIPAFDLPQYTVRAEMTYPQASEFAIPPAGLLGLFAPGFFGRGTGPFWGPWLRTEMGYVGILPLMLAAIAVAATWRRHTGARFWPILGAFGFLTAMGSYTALHGWSYALFPFFRQLRVPARAIFMFDFGIAILAATGLDLLLRPMSRDMRRILRSSYRCFVWIGGVLALVGLPLFGYAALVSRARSLPDVLAQTVASLNSFIFFLLMLGAGLGWLLLRRYALARPATLGVLAVALIAFDLISLGAYIEIEPHDPLAGYAQDDMLAFLKSDPGVFRVEVLPGAPVNWPPDWALLHEMDDLNGIWNPLRLGAYDVLTWIGIDRGSRYYDLYNVKYIVAHKDTAVPKHMERVFEHGDGVIYVNPHALPRAFVVHNAQVVGGAIKALNVAKKAGFDPATQVVLEEQFDVEPLNVDPGHGEQRVEIVDRDPNHLALRVATPAEGYLLVAEMWLPGWVAYVDGEKQAVVRANYTFRAVHLEPGVHEVMIVYRPRPWYIGLAITLLTLTALVLWAARHLIEKRR